MSANGHFLILRRYRAGDLDLILKAYGPCGLVKIIVPDGFDPSKGFLGITEPSNFLYIVYRQSGDVLIMKDVIKVIPLAYTSIKDYNCYLWRSSILLFVEKWFIHYDPDLFNMLFKYLNLNPKNRAVFLTRFKLEFLKGLGLYKEDIFKEELRKFVKVIAEEESFIKLERLRIEQRVVLELDKAIEDHLSRSL